MKIDIQFRLRVRRGELIVIGPGKVSLLEAIAASGSISAAARALGMSYRRAWLLVDEMNRGLANPVVDTMAGGNKGGGAVLTANALEIIKRYRAAEQRALKATEKELSALTRLIIK